MLGAGPSVVPKTSTVTETAEARAQRLTPEEWDLIRQFKNRREDPLPREEFDESKEFEERRPRRVILAFVPVRARHVPEVEAHHEEDFQGRLFDRFMRVSPPVFIGSTNVLEASTWLMGIERVLKRIGCPVEHKVSLATYQLRESAEFWWNALERKFEGRIEELTWTVFLEEFESKFYSNQMKAVKKTELLMLKQREMSVADYEAKFAELRRFAPELISTEKDKMFLFLQGMNPDLQVTIRDLSCTSLIDMVSKATSVEWGLYLQRSLNFKRPRDVSSSGQGGQGKKSNWKKGQQ
ncbi:hypothetical protein Dimus_038219 [Dionaea muscipula]